MAKIVCVLYDDPVSGHPTSYARDDVPQIDHYPGGQTVPSPKAIDFKPGELLGDVSGELGLRKYLESNGHTLVVTSSTLSSLQFVPRSFRIKGVYLVIGMGRRRPIRVRRTRLSR